MAWMEGYCTTSKERESTGIVWATAQDEL